MKGTLSEQPLAELIREISFRNFSGTLRLEQERAQAAVYFEKGRVVFAASNLRSLRLQEYLRKRSLVSEKELARLGSNLSDLDLGAALCTSGALTRVQIDSLLTAMVADVLRVTLLWITGGWDFNERARLGHVIELHIDVSNLLREAGQRLPLKFVSGRFLNPNELMTRSRDTASAANHLSASESFLLSRLDRPTRLQELVALSGMRDLDAYRVIYGLALSGLITREYWHHAFRAETAAVGKKEEGKAAARISDDAKASAEAARDGADLEAFLERLTTANDYYEVIDLPASASANEIKLAYYSLARRYHPDRFHLQSGTPQHTRISSAFARITQAYETLTDPAARSAYDAALKRTREFSGGARKARSEAFASDSTIPFAMGSSNVESEEAEQCFREGFAALQGRNIKLAVTQLAAAARLSPREARYRAHYGQALAASEETRRLAESELQAAIKLEPSNSTFRTMLAELYFDLNFHRRAQTELQRALALDPYDAKARALVRKLEKTRRTG